MRRSTEIEMTFKHDKKIEYIGSEMEMKFFDFRRKEAD